MTIARNIAGNGDCTCSAGEILIVDLSFRLSPTSDELAVLTGKEYAVTIFRPSDGAELFTFAGVIGPEGDDEDKIVRFVIPGAATAAVYADEAGYASWQIAEFVGTTPEDSGLKYWVKGRFSVSTAAASVTLGASAVASVPLTSIVIDATTQRLLVSNNGAPGKPGAAGADGEGIGSLIELDPSGSLTDGLTDCRDACPHGHLVLASDQGANNAVRIYRVEDGNDLTLIGSFTQSGMLNFRDFAVDGDYAFVTVQGTNQSPGNSVAVLDISDPTNPQLVQNKTSANLWRPAGIAASGKFLAVGSVANGVIPGNLVIFDRTDPAALVELAHWTAPASYSVSKFLFEGSRIYFTTQLLNQPSVFYVMDVADDGTLSEVGTLSLPDFAATNMDKQANIVVTCNEGGEGGFVLIDVSIPSAPTVLSQVGLPTVSGGDPTKSTTGVALLGTETVLLTDRFNNLLLSYDISDPHNPTLIDSTPADLNTPVRMAVQGKFIRGANRGTVGQVGAVPDTGGVASIDLGGRYLPTLAVGSGKLGKLLVDGMSWLAQLAVRGSAAIGGSLWVGRSLGVAGDVRAKTFNGQALGTAAFANSGDFATSAAVAQVKADAGYPIARRNTQILWTGSIAETVIETIVIPGGSLLTKGRFMLDMSLSCNASANLNRRVRVRLGSASGTVLANFTITLSTTLAMHALWGFANRNATNSQIGIMTGGAIYGESAATLPVFGVDSTQDITLVITAQLTNVADNVAIETYEARVFPAA